MDSLRPANSHYHVKLLYLLLIAESLALALEVSVSIPELVKVNDSFWLNCTANSHQTIASKHRADSDGSSNFPSDSTNPFQQQNQRAGSINDEIYAIKWYKDDEEFYRFLPNAQPKVSIYETNGIQLDVS